MSLSYDHLEKADEHVQWIPDRNKNDLRWVRNIKNSSPWIMSFVDPAFVFDDAFTLETLVLKWNIECELHYLIGTGSDTCDVL